MHLLISIILLKLNIKEDNPKQFSVLLQRRYTGIFAQTVFNLDIIEGSLSINWGLPGLC